MTTVTIVTAPSPNHIRTFTGGWINPVDPDPVALNLPDIAHALANQCRFTGHVTKFYSVAQHSVHVAEYIWKLTEDKDKAFDGLMHDASEAYVSDLARPVKRNDAISGAYNAIEDNLMGVIAKTFGFTWPMPDYVKEADDILLRTEQRDFMHGPTYDGTMLAKELGSWTPTIAEDAFLQWYRHLRG